MEPQEHPDTIARAKRGEPAAYEALLAEYGPRLYGYFLRTTGHHHDAEDLLAELSLRVVRTLERYDERGRLEPWLFRIAANLVRDRIRRRKTRGLLVSLASEDSDGGSLADRIPADGPAVGTAMRIEEAGHRVRQALAKLDDGTREMILLRHFGELSYKEIAAMCGCPTGTVLAKVHRGLKKLRDLLGADDGME